jgi:hypothetical protein
VDKEVAIVVKYELKSDEFYVDLDATETLYLNGNIYPASPNQGLTFDEFLTGQVAAKLAIKLGMGRRELGRRTG